MILQAFKFVQKSEQLACMCGLQSELTYNLLFIRIYFVIRLFGKFIKDAPS